MSLPSIDQIKEVIANRTDEEWQHLADVLIAERKADKDFFESLEFNTLFDIIKQHDMVDEEHLRYNVDAIKGLSDGDFCKVHNSIFREMGSEEIQEESEDFPKSYIDYKGVRFHLLIGQGSAIWTKLLKDIK